MRSAQLRFGGWISDIYLRWSFFLSSYVPLLVILAIRLSDKNETLTFVALVIASILVVNLALLLNWRVAPRDFSINSVESGSGEIAAYIATYLLPFLVVGDMKWKDLLAYAILVWTIGQAMTRDDVLHINPLLSILRYRIYTVTTKDGVDYYLIGTRRIAAGDRVRASLLLDRLLLER